MDTLLPVIVTNARERRAMAKTIILACLPKFKRVKKTKWDANETNEPFLSADFADNGDYSSGACGLSLRMTNDFYLLSGGSK